ncbi:cytochrome P450, partial [Chytriomyces sp. MP71]
GNLYDVFPDSLNNMRRLLSQYSPLMKLNMLGNATVVTNDPSYCELFANESETFWKRIYGALAEVKAIGGQGLFTTNSDDPDWILAHKLLLPAFSPKAIKAYSSEMGLLAHKLTDIFAVYARTGENVLITHWMTNFTFETIGKTGFGYDFHLLDDRDAPVHAFIKSMQFCMSECVNRVQQVPVYKKLPLPAKKKFERELRSMTDIVDGVIQVRKRQIANGEAVPKDLLTFMLTERTAQGEGMRDTLIRDQVMTFLIAGHETTSNTLSWALFELDRNPEVQAAVLQEITNSGISDEIPTDKQVSQLDYIERVIKETLRMHAPVRSVGKMACQDTVVPGNYKIAEGTRVQIAVDAMHHNPAVFANPDVFDPDRWLPENEAKRSQYSWMPFSTGARGCIGRQFAMQEAKIGLAVMLRRFKFTTIDPSKVSYDPKCPTTLPVNLWMKITKRENLPTAVAALPVVNPDFANGIPATVVLPTSTPLSPVTILYGSNTGTAADFAGQLAARARALGTNDVIISAVDEYLPKLKARLAVRNPNQSPDFNCKHLLLFVTPTYNGAAPDNATLFNKWISDPTTEAAQPLEGVHYGVFGCGNKQWRTYQMFPTKVDSALEALGGRRFVPAGAGDANDDIDGDFLNFMLTIKETVILTFGGQPQATAMASQAAPPSITDGFSSKIVLPSDPLWKEARETSDKFNSTILVNRELQNAESSGRSTRHLEITVSSPYLPGDHLEVYPQNAADLVESVAQGFGLALDATFVPTTVDPIGMISTRSIAANLTVGVPTTLRYILTNRADLLGPPTRFVVMLYAKKLAAADPAAAQALGSICGPGAKKEFDAFIKKHRTLLDLMNAHPQVTAISLDEFLCAVAVMTPRRYSIASSPLVYPNSVLLAVGVVDWVDPGSGKHYPGQCSGFFKRTSEAKDFQVEASVKIVKDNFRPPVDRKTPLIMVCAGTGLSPFMGFMQDRKSVGFLAPESETHLFFGCRNDDDYIYKEELAQFKEEGVLSGLHVAYSRKQGHPKKYVQHLIIDEAVLLWTLLNDQGGRLYVCGAAGGMAKDVRMALERVATMIGGVPEEKAAEWLEPRYIEDVWG